MTTKPSVILLLVLLPPLAAQNLLGLERGAAGVPVRVEEIGGASCRRMRECALPAPPSDPHAAPLGGIVFDSRNGNIYSSDGRDLVYSNRACGVICSSPNPFAPITGLRSVAGPCR
jgi:hypothetical protein